MTPRETALAFVAAINAHSVGAIANMITDNHTFVDSLGIIVKGKEEIRKAWIGYFYLVPDFSITYERVLDEGDTVAIFGTADGTCRVGSRVDPANHWSIPASWLVLVEGNKVVRWQIFADNEPIRKILGV